MKQLETLKKNLPKGIDIRISSNNVITFRARFRKRGHPEITQTFPDLKLAKHWFTIACKEWEWGCQKIQ